MTGSRDRTAVVALAATAWGLDGLLRKPLATALDPATVVLYEHLLVVLAVAWFIPGAVRSYLKLDTRGKLAVAAIGIGASAVATALFTEAFAISARTGDFVTPLVLQKLQPLFAVTLAVLLLKERVRARFGYYAIPALVGAWLVTFAHPFAIQLSAVQAGLLAVGAAILWAAGTVLGRLVSGDLTPRELTVLRFCWGLPAAFVIALQTHASLTPGWHNLPGLALLAFIPGLGALALYYYGLRTTPASRATFAELAFPATAVVVGVLFLGGTALTGTQWLGLAVLVVAITGLALNERRPHPAVQAPTELIGAVTP